MIAHIRILAWDSPEQQVLRHIRETVFIREQGVPESLEWDEHDPRALHFLYYSEHGEPVACARLVPEESQARIGRMAVLPDHRRRGIARSLLRYVLNYARSEPFQRAVLSAQTQVADFYASEGFVTEGEVYEEAGIPHIRMTLQLREAPSETPQVVGKDRQSHQLTQWEDISAHLVCLIRQCTHRLDIVTDTLPAALFGHPDIAERLKYLSRRRNQPSVRMIIREPAQCMQQSGELHSLLGRLSTALDLRQPLPEARSADEPQYVIVDEMAVLYQHRTSYPEGFACYYDPARARMLTSDFEALFSRSVPCPEFRQLSL
ncbi:GNAT family N-acetyltransferase [Hahella sp. SMD15-11]|uniref:GNAT family N-acetyltransferase n=1 Tax=Thermohahella caldifontis TaxID=3142973 RepID=A0AB39UXA2_9GAMM